MHDEVFKNFINSTTREEEKFGGVIGGGK